MRGAGTAPNELAPFRPTSSGFIVPFNMGQSLYVVSKSLARVRRKNLATRGKNKKQTQRVESGKVVGTLTPPQSRSPPPNSQRELRVTLLQETRAVLRGGNGGGASSGLHRRPRPSLAQIHRLRVKLRALAHEAKKSDGD